VVSANIEAVLNNPLSISDADLERMLAEQSGEEVSVPTEDELGEDAVDADQDDETGGTSAASGDKAIGAQAQGSEGQELDPSKAEVRTRDGKHSIPYSVLQRARDEANAERQAREALEAKIAELEQRGISVGTQNAATDPVDVADVIDAERLEALREEAPELAAMIEALATSAKAAEARAAAAERTAQESQQREQFRVREASNALVEGAISNSPKLVWTRSEKPEVYNRIVDYDNFLRASEEGRSMDLPTRLAKAISMYEAVNGAIEVPGSARPGPKTTPKVAEPKFRVPSTLSDMPGGSSPAKSDAEQIGDLSGTDLALMMGKMTEAEQVAFLARVAL
jgi:hypothetical protein